MPKRKKPGPPLNFRKANQQTPEQALSDKELIEQAVKEGKVTKCPEGSAEGALKWWSGGAKGGN